MKYKTLVSLSLIFFLLGSGVGYFLAYINIHYYLRSEHNELKSCIEDYHRFKGRYPTENEGLNLFRLESVSKDYNGEYLINMEFREFVFGEFVYLPIPADSDEPTSYRLLFEVYK